MPYSANGFSTIGASKAGASPSIYAYSTPDTIADVNTSGYFNALSSFLRNGDYIFCNTSTGGTLVASIVYVVSNAFGVVDVNNGTVLDAADSD